MKIKSLIRINFIFIALCLFSGCATMHPDDNKMLFASIKEVVNITTCHGEFLLDACSSNFSKKILSEFQQIEADIVWIRDVKWMPPKFLLSPYILQYDSRLTNEVVGCAFVSPFDTLLKNRAFVVLSLWGPARTSIISFDRMGNMTKHRVTEENKQDCILYDFYPVLAHMDPGVGISIIGYYLHTSKRAQIHLHFIEEQCEVFFYATKHRREN